MYASQDVYFWTVVPAPRLELFNYNYLNSPDPSVTLLWLAGCSKWTLTYWSHVQRDSDRHPSADLPPPRLELPCAGALKQIGHGQHQAGWSDPDSHCSNSKTPWKSYPLRFYHVLLEIWLVYAVFLFHGEQSAQDLWPRGTCSTWNA